MTADLFLPGVPGTKSYARRPRWDRLVAIVLSCAMCLATAVLAYQVTANDRPATPPPAVPTPHDALAKLNWLLGDWQFHFESFTLNRSVTYSPNGNYMLVRDTARDHSDTILYRELTIIAYNPVSELFETWVFRDSGGFGGGVMELFGNQWLVPVRMILADGRTSTCNYIYTPSTEGRYTLQPTSRTLGGLAIPDLPPALAQRVTPHPEDTTPSFVF
ncbi:MAG: hypothetical protein Q4G68_05055 [Planctomycetia bacterium]|nr:hypothetical protein [Planctomycetia bacterium]